MQGQNLQNLQNNHNHHNHQNHVKEFPKNHTKRKQKIPVAFREQIWIRTCGKVFESKCPTPWCQNTITVFDFHSGHNIPESKGGETTPENLFPICARCNLSMGDRYTFDEWCLLSKPVLVVNLSQIHPHPVIEVKPKQTFYTFIRNLFKLSRNK